MQALRQLFRRFCCWVSETVFNRAEIGGTDFGLDGQLFLRKTLFLSQSFQIFTESFGCVQNNPSVYRVSYYKV